MSEKILFEHQIQESEGFDQIAQPSLNPRTGQPQNVTPTTTSSQQATVTTDIAKTAPKTIMTKNAISVSLPYMISYVQPMVSSVGYVFGLQQKDRTQIPTDVDDVVVIRKLAETQVREVILDITNETAQDIQNLFGSDFPENYDNFIQTGGEVWNGPNGELARFFLSMARQRIVSKINKDFTDWIADVATKKGKATIANWSAMEEIIGVIAELRESLFKATGKSGQYWILVSPKIGSYLSTYYGAQHSDADIFTSGKINPKGVENGYVTTIGDIKVFQHDFYGNVTGGTASDSEDKGVIYMGYRGNAGTSSVYYMPYNETIVQGGEDYFDGQSKIFYKVRDTWETNPLDTYDSSITEVELGTNTQAIPGNNKSSFIMQADIIFSDKLIKP